MNHSGHDHMMIMNHAMTFHFGDNEVLLFNFWTTSSPGMMVLSCLIVVLLCIIMEAVRWQRSFRKATKKQVQPGSQMPSFRRPQITVALCLETVMHAIQLTIGYILMLLFMTFNVWICIAVVLGEVIGRFIFSAFFSSPEMTNPQNKSRFNVTTKGETNEDRIDGETKGTTDRTQILLNCKRESKQRPKKKVELTGERISRWTVIQMIRDYLELRSTLIKMIHE
uniref:Copper transport protein n=1 Tax=Ascaris lumbricoides TaxID=6252 RepID=A0A9J2P6K7_ASCLU